MAVTSKYFVTLSPSSNLLDFDLAYGALSLQGQDIVFTGTNGIDNVTVAPGVIFDFTKSNSGIDNLYLTGNLADYTTTFTTSTVTLSRGAGASAETVLLAKGTSLNYDTVVFANGSASTFDLHGWAAGGAIPTLGAAPVQPTTLNATVKGFALDATGEVFTGTAAGISFIATGGNGVDIVYVKSGATVDASKLNSGEDKIYFTGNWADYTKAATTSKITFTNGTSGETVIVAAATGASNDMLVFADGNLRTNDAKAALQSDANIAATSITTTAFGTVSGWVEGWSTSEVTPLPGPSVTSVTDNVGSVTGALTSGQTTDDTALVLAGSCNAGSTVNVYNGTTLLGAASVAGTNWSYTATVADGVTYQFNVRETDAAGNISAATSNFTVTGDTTAPVILSMTADSTTKTIALTYDSELDPANLPVSGDFAVTTGGVSNAVASISVAGMVVTLTLQGDFTPGVVNVAYTDPAGDAVNAVQDLAGNDAATFTSGVVADGYVRGAQIWIDSNGDGTADYNTGLVTNADGNFFYLPAGTPVGTLIAVGGVNIDTGVPNTIALKAPAGSTTINPLTTLVQAVMDDSGVSVAAASVQVVAALGLTGVGNLTGFDPLASNNVGAQQAAAQVAAILSLAETNSAGAATGVVGNLAVQIQNASSGGATLDLQNAGTLGTALNGTGIDLATQNSIANVTAAIGAATNLAGISAAQSTGLDRIAPATPAAPDLLASSDTGLSRTDNSTTYTAPTVRVSFNHIATDGTAAVVGDTIAVMAYGVQVGSTTLGTANIAAGFADITTTILAEGTHSLTATLTDRVGNPSSTSSSLSITVATALADPIIFDTASYSNFTHEMARFANAAYGDWAFAPTDSNAPSSGWQPVSLKSMVSAGVFMSGVETANGLYADQFGVASAQVYSALVDGKKTLLLAFRGTDDFLTDIPDYFPNFAHHYQRFAPLFSELAEVIVSQGIDQVLVAGHSLGGAIAQMYMDDHANGNGVEYKAATFGSPGAGSQANSDNRITHFNHTKDPVAASRDLDPDSLLAGLAALSGQSTVALTALLASPLGDPNHYSGGVVSIERPDVGVQDSTAEHGLPLYLETLQLLSDADSLAPAQTVLTAALNTPENYRLYRGSSADDEIRGDDGNIEGSLFDPFNLFDPDTKDILFGRGGNDTIYGGANDDILVGDFITIPAGHDSSSALYASGNDILYGGAGNDVLVGGKGADTLSGGAGADWFVFNSCMEGGDTITDFSWGDVDRIVLNALNFGTLAAVAPAVGYSQVLAAECFAYDTPNDANDYLVFNQGTNVLSYYPTGNQSAVSYVITTLPDIPMDAEHILLVANKAVGPSTHSNAIVLSSDPGPDQTYAAGDTVRVTVGFDEAVFVNTTGGAPTLALTIGNQTRYALYESGNGTSGLVFGYTVADGEQDTGGIGIGANSLSLNGATIRDADGHDAYLLHAAKADDAGHLVDGSASLVGQAVIALGAGQGYLINPIQFVDGNGQIQTWYTWSLADDGSPDYTQPNGYHASLGFGDGYVDLAVDNPNLVAINGVTIRLPRVTDTTYMWQVANIADYEMNNLWQYGDGDAAPDNWTAEEFTATGWGAGWYWSSQTFSNYVWHYMGYLTSDLPCYVAYGGDGVVAGDYSTKGSSGFLALQLVTITTISTAPTFSSAAAASVAENTATSATVYDATADADNGITYTLGGTDAAKFGINATTGAVTFVTSPDFETPTDTGANNIYDLTVTATDAASNAADRAVAITVTDVVVETLAGNDVIDLGAYGKLIAPVQVDGNWYYYWDRSGDGTGIDTGSLNGGVDYTTHNVLDGIFTQDINGVTGGGGNTTDTYRYATLNGVQLALPTANGGAAYPGGVIIDSANK